MPCRVLWGSALCVLLDNNFSDLYLTRSSYTASHYDGECVLITTGGFLVLLKCLAVLKLEIILQKDVKQYEVIMHVMCMCLYV